MKRFEMWGNKKNIQSEAGKVYLTEAQEKEFTELGIIVDGLLVDDKGIRTPYYIRETGSRIFQFHIPKSEWGKTYNLYSEKMDEGGRRKVIFVPDKERFEIWENPKGEKRKMVKRVDGLDKVTDIVNTWNDTYDSEISVEELEEAIR